jgi:transcriptional regulator with XRE-family HTH domain
MSKNWELEAVRSELKRILKQKKFSYKKLAKVLGVAEITVKRFFTSEDVSFVKLQQICRVIGISALELVALVQKGGEETFSLSEEQEEFFCKNERLYEFFVCLLKSRSIEIAEIKGHFKNENIPRFLRELEKLDLIEVPIGDSVHVKRHGVLTWISGGPLQKKFMRVRHSKYLDSFERQLQNPLNYLASSQRHLRPESIEEMKRDLEFVVHKFRSRAYREETIYSDDQLVPVAWLVGLGPHKQLAVIVGRKNSRLVGLFELFGSLDAIDLAHCFSTCRSNQRKSMRIFA